MKTAEFIGLLNLYLDHEIAPEDAARLEAEVARVPEHHEIYRQYCRMQKACAVLGEEWSQSSGRAEAAVRRPVLSRSSGLWLGGLAAAGLAVALLMGHRPPMAPVPATAAVAVVKSVSFPAATAAAAGQMQPVFFNGSAPLLLADGAAPQFAWMNGVQFTPIVQIRADKLLPGAKPGLELDNRGVEYRPVAPTAADTTAFQFQR